MTREEARNIIESINYYDNVRNCNYFPDEINKYFGCDFSDLTALADNFYLIKVDKWQAYRIAIDFSTCLIYLRKENKNDV